MRQVPLLDSALSVMSRCCWPNVVVAHCCVWRMATCQPPSSQQSQQRPFVVENGGGIVATKEEEEEEWKVAIAVAGMDEEVKNEDRLGGLV